MILPFSETIIPIILTDLPDNRDFLFEPTRQANIAIFAYIVDYRFRGILVRNELDQLI